MKIKCCIATLSAALLLAGSCVMPASAITEEEYRETFSNCIRLWNSIEGQSILTNGLIVGINEQDDALYIATDASLLAAYDMQDESCWYYGDVMDSNGNQYEIDNYFEVDLVYVTEDGSIAIYSTDYSEVKQYVGTFLTMTDITAVQEGDEARILYNSPEAPYPPYDWYGIEFTVSEVSDELDIVVLDESKRDVDFLELGATVMNENGYCFGLTSVLLADEEGTDTFYYIHGFKEVMEYLDSVGASYSYIPASSIKTSSDSDNTDSGSTGSDEETAQRYQDLGALIAKIAIPVIVLVVCLIIYFKTKKEKKNNSAGTIPADTGKTVELPPPVQPEKTIQYIKGIGGVHRDTEFPLVMPLVKIGRDPSVSQIVLPSDSIAVSREHCYLQRTETGWILVDVSNYGTFLNGVKMEKNKSYSLKCGDTISIGEPAHTFIIG